MPTPSRLAWRCANCLDVESSGQTSPRGIGGSIHAEKFARREWLGLLWLCESNVTTAINKDHPASETQQVPAMLRGDAGALRNLQS
jgi:hypothetical protein